MLNPFLRIEHISKKYGEFSALNDISIDIAEGEFICLLGPSGCGKTTLLRIIAGLEKPTEGKVFLKGSDATDYHPSKRNFGIVFQSYALFPNMTVEQNIGWSFFAFHGTIVSGDTRCWKKGKWNAEYLKLWTQKVWCPQDTCCAK